MEFTGVDKMAHKPIKGTQATKRHMSHKEGTQAMENSEIKGKHSTDVAGGSGKRCEIKLDLGKSSEGNFELRQAVRRASLSVRLPVAEFHIYGSNNGTCGLVVDSCYSMT
jgi:hypothetical protein